MQAALANAHRYPDSGALALRQAISSRFGLTHEHVLCTNGSDEAVFLTCLAFLGDGDAAVMANGSFISYYLRTLEMGGEAVRVPLRDYTHDLKAMAQAITDRTRLLLVCNPNNPTGTASSAAELARLLEQVPEDVLVVVDEAYAEFVDRPDYPDLAAELRAGRRNLLLLRTFAKIYGLAGLRLGYALGHPDLIAYLDRARPTFNVNAIAQAGALAALGDEAHVARSRAHAIACRARFTRELRALGLSSIPTRPTSSPSRSRTMPPSPLPCSSRGLRLHRSRAGGSPATFGSRTAPTRRTLASSRRSARCWHSRRNVYDGCLPPVRRGSCR
jgi:histidinol-phosphate aminotransferase